MNTNANDAIKLSPLNQWCNHHWHAWLSSINEIIKKPLASLMTLMVISIAIALPFGLYILLQNLQDFSQHWNSQGSFSLYLKRGTPDFQITTMLNHLKSDKRLKNVRYISPQQGLKEFQATSQSSHLLSSLKQNPLPGVIMVIPAKSEQTTSKLKELITQLQQYTGADASQIDMAWVKNLYAIIAISERVIYFLALVFGLGVLLIVSNTIRLIIEHHHQEMLVLKLIGATDSFIRRPLLYLGTLYGLIGGVLAWALVGLMALWLKSPVETLASFYHQNQALHGLPLSSVLLILTLSTSLGALGAWLTTHFQLGKLD